MWIAGLTSSLVGWLADNSDAGLHAWNALPTELKNDVPSWARVALLAVIFFGSFAAARLIRQPVRKRPSEHWGASSPARAFARGNRYRCRSAGCRRVWRLPLPALAVGRVAGTTAGAHPATNRPAQ